MDSECPNATAVFTRFSSLKGNFWTILNPVTYFRPFNDNSLIYCLVAMKSTDDKNTISSQWDAHAVKPYSHIRDNRCYTYTQ